MAACDIDQLLADGQCWTCLEPKEADAVELELLCQIVEALDELTD